MKAYLAVTAILFALLTIAHIWRMVVESSVVTDPWFLATTALSTLLSLWGARLYLSMRARTAATV